MFAHQGVAGRSTAIIHAHSDIAEATNKPLLAEEGRMQFSTAHHARMIDVDIDLVATHGPVHLADKKGADVSIRAPDSMAPREASDER